ncbi:MAG: hypothetical protein HC853_09685 [Anaerolineae bacterium]|nr:hypothetical protein [Anaerolineae bacterium]
MRPRYGEDAKKVADKMLKDNRVVFAELDWLTGLDANPSRIGAWGELTPPRYLHQDATALLGLPQAHAITRGRATSSHSSTRVCSSITPRWQTA